MANAYTTIKRRRTIELPPHHRWSRCERLVFRGSGPTMFSTLLALAVAVAAAGTVASETAGTAGGVIRVLRAGSELNNQRHGHALDGRSEPPSTARAELANNRQLSTALHGRRVLTDEPPSPSAWPWVLYARPHVTLRAHVAAMPALTPRGRQIRRVLVVELSSGGVCRSDDWCVDSDDQRGSSFALPHCPACTGHAGCQARCTC